MRQAGSDANTRAASFLFVSKFSRKKYGAIVSYMIRWLIESLPHFPIVCFRCFVYRVHDFVYFFIGEGAVGGLED